MRQLGLFEHQDLKELQNGIPDVRYSGKVERRRRIIQDAGDVRMEWRRRNFGCDMPDRMLAEENFRMWETSGWNGGGRNSRCDGRPCGMTTEEFRMWDMSRWNECGYE